MYFPPNPKDKTCPKCNGPVKFEKGLNARFYGECLDKKCGHLWTELDLKQIAQENYETMLKHARRRLRI